jgi:hypothetical protein
MWVLHARFHHGQRRALEDSVANARADPRGLDGNICRCGTFSRIFRSRLSVKGVTVASPTNPRHRLADGLSATAAGAAGGRPGSGSAGTGGPVVVVLSFHPRIQISLGGSAFVHRHTSSGSMVLTK